MGNTPTTPTSWGCSPFSPRQSRSPLSRIQPCTNPWNIQHALWWWRCRKTLQLAASVSPSEPHFLHAAEYGNYVYFFYREIAVEQSSLGKVSGHFYKNITYCGTLALMQNWALLFSDENTWGIWTSCVSILRGFVISPCGRCSESACFYISHTHKQSIWMFGR